MLNEELLVLLVHQPNLHTGGANLGKFANVELKIKWNILSGCNFLLVKPLHDNLREKLPTLDAYSTAQPDDMYDVADEAELQEMKDKKHPWTAPGEDSRNL